MVRAMVMLVIFGVSASFAIRIGLAQTPQAGENELTEAEAELVELCEEMAGALRAFFTKGEQLQDPVQQQKFFAEQDPSAHYVARLLAFEREHRGSHAGLMALRRLILLGVGGGPLHNPLDLGRREAFQVLPAYARAPVLPEILRYVDGGNVEPATETLLRQLLASPDISEQNREFARYMLAVWILHERNSRAYLVRRSEELAADPSPESAKEREWVAESLKLILSPERLAQLEPEAVGILTNVAGSSAALHQPAVRGADSRYYIIRQDPPATLQRPLIRDLAAGRLFQEQHLQVGRPAPPLDLKLLDDTNWSLHAQRSKTVVIQFSFKGCGPCEAMYPDLRELCSTYSDKLTVLSIMADPTREDAVAAVKTGKMTWQVHWEGEKGPIATKWAVASFPTVYVIGPDGRIAASQLRGERLKQKVAELVR